MALAWLPLHIFPPAHGLSSWWGSGQCDTVPGRWATDSQAGPWPGLSVPAHHSPKQTVPSTG